MKADLYDFLIGVINRTPENGSVPITIHVLLESGWVPDRKLTEDEVTNLELKSKVPEYFWVMLDYVKHPYTNFMEDC